MAPPWGFYGRAAEQSDLRAIRGRGRWFFAKVTGRRRIGKTTLIQRALQDSGRERVFYCQVPDSGPAGVLSAVGDAMETFRLPAELQRPRSLLELARLVAALARAGWVVALDEFQYFHRKHLQEFCSFLQSEVDGLSAEADRVPGGLIVLGCIHTEMMAVLDDRSAPLFNRVTDELDLEHLDIASVVEILETHGGTDGQRLLFLWNLFEGVPKFYRDCYEQDVLESPRRTLLRRMFFQSSSPLRAEADNWFLKELHGRYDAVLKTVARRPGRNHKEILNEVQQSSSETREQVAGYLKILEDKYRMIERRLPLFASPRARRGRYYVADNFLRCWLACLAPSVAAVNFVPLDQLVADADEKLAVSEGHGFEQLVAHLYEERSRKGIGDLPLTQRIQAYWDKKDTEIDLVAVSEDERRVRLGHCKRNAEKLLPDARAFEDHIDRFLKTFPQLADWRVEKVALAPVIGDAPRRRLAERGWIVEDLADLLEGIR